jgi:hypothetical protein
MPPPTIATGTGTVRAAGPVALRARIAWPIVASSLTNAPAIGRSPLIDRPTSAAADEKQNSRRVGISG